MRYYKFLFLLSLTSSYAFPEYITLSLREILYLYSGIKNSNQHILSGLYKCAQFDVRTHGNLYVKIYVCINLDEI